MSYKTILCCLALAVGLLIAPRPVDAQVPGAIPLTKSDHNLLARLESYLARVKTMRARFLQVSSNGGVAEGLFELSRPGRMRILYDPPVPVEIVADGDWIHYHDKELRQVTSSPIGWTPAAPLLAEEIKLKDGNYVVTGLNRAADAVIVSLVDEDEPASGTLTLVFTDQPLALRKWSVTDSQGVVTSVTLMAPDYNITLDKELFSFENPYPDVMNEENR